MRKYLMSQEFIRKDNSEDIKKYLESTDIVVESWKTTKGIENKIKLVPKLNSSMHQCLGG